MLVSVTAVVFADNDLIVTASMDRTIRTWNVKDAKEPKKDDTTKPEPGKMGMGGMGEPKSDTQPKTEPTEPKKGDTAGMGGTTEPKQDPNAKPPEAKKDEGKKDGAPPMGGMNTPGSDGMPQAPPPKTPERRMTPSRSHGSGCGCRTTKSLRR